MHFWSFFSIVKMPEHKMFFVLEREKKSPGSCLVVVMLMAGEFLDLYEKHARTMGK